MILVNKRNYYDNLYYYNNISYLADVHFNRENDEYLKGLEYLSSLNILSKCSGFIGGNCGGSQLAVFLNNLNYSETYVFNLGYY